MPFLVIAIFALDFIRGKAMPGRLLNNIRRNNNSASLGSHEVSVTGIQSVDHTTTAPQSAMDHLKRSSVHGIPGLSKHHKHQDRDKKGSPSPSRNAQKPANQLDLIIESPPNIFHGSPQTSSGVLMSGRLRVGVVNAPEITLESFSMELIVVMTAKKPVAKDCSACAHRTTELHNWKFLNEPKRLEAGQHDFPFSHLIPGHLPITTHGHLGVLEYFLVAKATTRSGEELNLKKPIQLSRSLPPAPEKNSLRVFPPTNLTAHVTLAPTIYPIGTFTALLRISGVTDKASGGKKDIQTRWRLRKLTWKLEETEHMVSAACNKHAGKVGGEGRGFAHEDTRLLARQELKEGWKSDFDAGDIEMEISGSTTASPRPLCDVESPSGMHVTHALVVELVIAEEWIPLKKTNAQPTPTGGARVLRAQFALIVTERAGLGISWDEEQPPMYEDVPASPPLYSQDGRRPGQAGAEGESTAGTRRSSGSGRGEITDVEGGLEALNLADDTRLS